MNNKEIITKNDGLCLLEDDERVFIIKNDGAYMSAEEMQELGAKMLLTAEKYGKAITAFNDSRGANNESQF